jgi:uncharacterized protein (UPF0212 family)
MSTPDTPSPRPSRPELAAHLTQELLQMRDALVTLSLSLKDWQFELDQRGDRISQQMTNQALEKFRLQPPIAGDRTEASKARASEGS